MEAHEIEFDVPAPVAPPDPVRTSGAVVKIEDASSDVDLSKPMNMIERLTLDHRVPIERAEQAFAFWRKVQEQQAKKAFTAAMIACQEEMEPIRKDAANRQTSSRYATYAALDRALRPIYTKHGFYVTHDTEPSPLPDHVRVLCFVNHREGHERIFRADIPCDGKGARGGDVMTKTHAVGSAMSYGKRYTTGNAFNVATEGDDDGNAAGGIRATASEFISTAQVAELEAIAKKVGASIERFCAYGDVPSLNKIRTAQFESAKQILLSYKPARGAQ